jgi:Chaperone of endosialidase
MSKPEPPTPPDPRLTAGLSTATNVSTALANARLNAVNQTTPTGALTYNFDTTNQYSFVDPATGSTYYIPTITAQQTLSPAQQEIQNRSEAAQTNLAGLAADQSGRISSLLGSPIDLSQAPAAGNIDPLRNLLRPQTSFADTGAPQGTFADAGQQTANFGPAGQQVTNFGAAGAGDITGTFGPEDDFSSDRSRVEQALFGRLDPQLERGRQLLEQQLADQGIRYGSPAYAAAMSDWSRQANDLRLGVTQTAGQEQQRLFEMARGRAQFENQAQQQAFSELLQGGQFANAAQAAHFLQQMQRGQFANEAQQRAYEQAQGRGAFANTAQQNAYAQALGRGNFFNAGALMQAQQAQAILNAENARRANYLSERYAERQEPINEITALLSGSQVSRPSFVTTPQTTIPTTDIAGLINQNFAQQFGNYQQQAQSQDRLLGGILGLGSNLGAALISDRRAKENIHRMGTVLATTNNNERERLPIYQYSYKGDPASTRHVGPMAQDVEKIDPRAVGETRGGTKYINRRRVMGSILRAA